MGNESSSLQFEIFSWRLKQCLLKLGDGLLMRIEPRPQFDRFRWKWKQHLLKLADRLVMKTGPRSFSTFIESSLCPVYLPADGQSGPFKFINMCVTDTLLMCLYNCYLKFDKVRSLFNTHETLRAAMIFLHARMYNEAKACWLFALAENFTIDSTIVTNSVWPYFKVNAWSEPKHHLKILNELVLGTCSFDQNRETQSISQGILNNILREFEEFGDVHAFGIKDSTPVCIIVDVDRRLDTAPPLIIYDDYDRHFELQFLLMTRKSHPVHVIAWLHRFHGWALYDDLKIKHENFDPGNADFKDDFIILLAGYISIEPEKADHVILPIPEEGRYGTRVFNPSSYSNIHEKQH